MTRLLIVESNLPERCEADIAAGRLPTARAFGEAFRTVDATVEYRVAAPYAGETANLDGIDGVVFTGSGVVWNTSDDRAAPLRRVMEQSFTAGLPVFGSCNGMQLAVSVLGGTIGECPNGNEHVIATGIRLTADGRGHPLLAGRSDGYAVPCGHRDEVRALPPGAVVLAGNEHTRVQALAVEGGDVDFWGVQYHPECRIIETARWLKWRLPETPDETIALYSAAETDPEAAARVGTSPEEMADAQRLTELRNWLAHVAGKKDNVPMQGVTETAQ